MEQSIATGGIDGAARTPALGPARERYVFLDLLRGVALLGILPENIPYFALPSSSGEPSIALADPRWTNVVPFYVTRLLGDYKFLSIFSLLFGVGLALIQQRCAQSGRAFRGLYLRRIGVLAAIGLAHAWLLWCGDILFYYALGGFVVMWTARWSARALRRAGIALFCVPVVLMVGLALLVSPVGPAGVRESIADALRASEAVATTQPGALATMPFLDQLQYLGPELERLIYAQGSYGRITALQFVTWLTLLPVFVLFVGWRILGLFMIGVALLKAGWFVDPRQGIGRFRNLALSAGPLGLAMELVSAALISSRHEALAQNLFAEALHYAGSIGLSAVYMWLVAELYARGRDGRLARGLAAVGRTALSGYILQSVLCAFVFYAYGLGAFGRMTRLELWGVVAGVWAVNVAFANLWMWRFRFGPLEWCWRKLTYGSGMSAT
ncbi:MAG: hypothetical protein CHACPFDD_03578 [Phycisphaerae bacterium]|nr:hypothetical protein [Phycisphaerae bacterium]